jgi:hypothetical protein
MKACWSLCKHGTLPRIRIVDAIKTEHYAQFLCERQKYLRYHLAGTNVFLDLELKTRRNAEKVPGQNNVPHGAPTWARQQGQGTS